MQNDVDTMLFHAIFRSITLKIEQENYAIFLFDFKCIIIYKHQLCYIIVTVGFSFFDRNSDPKK